MDTFFPFASQTIPRYALTRSPVRSHFTNSTRIQVKENGEEGATTVKTEGGMKLENMLCMLKKYIIMKEKNWQKKRLERQNVRASEKETAKAEKFLHFDSYCCCCCWI